MPAPVRITTFEVFWKMSLSAGGKDSDDIAVDINLILFLIYL
jgi:hypothetical protein